MNATLSRRVRTVLTATVLTGGALMPLSGAAHASDDVPPGYVYETSYGLFAECERAGGAGIQAGRWGDFRCVPTWVNTKLYIHPVADTTKYEVISPDDCTEGGGTVKVDTPVSSTCEGGTLNERPVLSAEQEAQLDEG